MISASLQLDHFSLHLGEVGVDRSRQSTKPGRLVVAAELLERPVVHSERGDGLARCARRPQGAEEARREGSSSLSLLLEFAGRGSGQAGYCDEVGHVVLQHTEAGRRHQ